MDQDKENTGKSNIANRVLLACALVVVYSVVWLFILEWLNSDNDIGPNIKLLVGVVGASVVLTDWVYFKKVKGNK